tara:strand:- start:244 stop:513 length:270 start_codon:yes stop_codon:yes gene_type:complete
MKPSNFFNQKNFPNLEFDTLEDAEASYISISQAHNIMIEKKIDYRDHCLNEGIDQNPLKVKKMNDDSLSLLQLKEAIEDIINQFNAKAA